jgi:hypothetical protein
MPTWPTAGGFPQAPLALSWSRQRQDIVDEFKPEQGPARLRKKVVGGVDACRGSFLLTEAQRQTLEDFWRIECARGAITFLWRDPEQPSVVRTWEWIERPSIPHRTLGLYRASIAVLRL